MDYLKHYNHLCERSFTRELPVDTYVEKHHIVPRCLGGTDDILNIAILTPEEHYVAHQLLVKIYPTNHKLLYGANILTSRPNNKSFGWIRRKLAEAKRGVPRDQKTVDKMIETRRNNGGWISPTKGTIRSAESNKKAVETRKQKGSYKGMGKNLIGRQISEAELEKRRRKISIDGIVYASLKDAAALLNTPVSTIYKRLQSHNYATYYYMENKV